MNIALVYINNVKWILLFLNDLNITLKYNNKIYITQIIQLIKLLIYFFLITVNVILFFFYFYIYSFIYYLYIY